MTASKIIIVGTVTGFAIRHDEKEIVCLPGVPGEIQSLADNFVELYAGRHKAQGWRTVTKNLHFFGISDRDVENSIKDCLVQEDHTEAVTFVHDSIVTVMLLAAARERENAEKIVEKTELDIRKKLGPALFGVDDETLEHAVVMLLKKYNMTIAVAESCTGGLVSDKLTNIPGISEFFLEGVVAYSNEAKINVLGVPEELIQKHGAVSSHVARAMADGIKKLAIL